MDYRDFGTTGLKVSALGFGAGQVGDETIPDKQVESLLNTALDEGINLIDTARGYGVSEERIGKFISHRRDEFVLSTKVGYDIPGREEWSYDCVREGIDVALQRMKTDYLDIVHLHTCPLEVLRRGEAIDALDEAVRQGKVRVAAYSGDNEELDFAIHSGRFGSAMSSLNVCEQGPIDRILHVAKEKGMGYIAKRPIANAPWRFAEQPHGHYCEEYWHRWQAMALEFDMDLNELALRFTAYTWGVDSCIVGTTNLEHLKHNIAQIRKGKLPEEIIERLRKAHQRHGGEWRGQA